MEISRRDFLKFAAGGVAIVATGEVALLAKILDLNRQTESYKQQAEILKQQTEALSQQTGNLQQQQTAFPKQQSEMSINFFPDIEIPQEELKKIAEIDRHLKNIRERIMRGEGGEVPELNSDSIFLIYLAKKSVAPFMRSGLFAYPDDVKVWITGKGSYKYDFGAALPEFSGGTTERQKQAKEVFDAYLTKDQWRVAGVKLTDHNLTSPDHVQWAAGKELYNPADPILWDVFGAYIHELTHAGIPLNAIRQAGDKSILLPYGLKGTLDFVNPWVKALDEEYDYFQNRFFRAPGDATLGMIRHGKGVDFQSGLNEMIAMSCADYIFPPINDELFKIAQGEYEPFAKYPLTEEAIRKSIAYVHYGVKAGDLYPNGVDSRNALQPGNISGDIFWKIVPFTDIAQNGAKKT